MTTSPRNRYVTDAVATVSPARLVVMLYDRLALDLVRAHEALAGRRDIAGAHEALVHAQEIVVELHSALDPTRWATAQHLADVYTYLLDLLVRANVRKDQGLVAEGLAIVEPLRDAWHQAAGAGTTPTRVPA